MENGGNQFVPAVAFPLLQEGITSVLSRWTALQLAVENQWGGPNTHLSVQLLHSQIFTWFTHNPEPRFIDDLETILDNSMLSLNTEVDDGSIEEVAQHLFVMHEQFLDGNSALLNG